MTAVIVTLSLCSLYAKDISTKNNIETDDIPQELIGKFPFATPTCTGEVKDLKVLSSSWIVVVIYDLPNLADKINELSNGQLYKAIDDWEKSKKEGKPNWTAFKLPGKIHEQFLAQAREESNERELDNKDNFTISSNDDKNYKDTLTPAYITRVFISLGATRIKGMHEVDYAHYIYMKLPYEMQNGKNYKIKVANRGEAEIKFDDKSTISWAIKINQAGYLKDFAKFAYLGAFTYEFGPVDFSKINNFSIVDVEDGKDVFKGEIKLIEKNPRFSEKPSNNKNSENQKNERPSMYGEDVYLIDFSDLKKEGVFFISIPGVGRSWPFKIGKNAYGEAFYTATRGLFHQRAAFALERQFTAWTRPKSKMHDTIYESENISFPIQSEPPKGYSHFDVIGATTDLSKETKNVVGGWYDAADWDRNEHHYVCVFDLLNAYEFDPEKFTDDQLNIPESGNKIPDILDEASFGIDCWLKSMDSKGGISGYIETSTHPDYDDPNYPYTFSRRTRWNSLCYAAAAAQLAYNIRNFDEKKSEKYAESAKKAYEFGINPENSLGKIIIHAKKNRGKGEAYTFEWEEKDEYNIPYLIHAKMQLFKLTGDKNYLNGIPDLLKKTKRPFDYRFSHKDFSAWTLSDIAIKGNGILPDEIVQEWRNFYLNIAENLYKNLNQNPYKNTWPRYQNYWAGWGASCMTNFNRALAIAYKISGDKKYLDAIIANADFMLGANPLGMSWTTGIGFVYPIDIQHANSENDEIMDPVPGITIYGITGAPPMHYKRRELIWENKKGENKVSFIKEVNKNVPFFRAWSCHPALNTGQCEFTIHETMSSTIFTTAILLEKNWKPDEKLKNRKPRSDKYLFGYFYLP